MIKSTVIADSINPLGGRITTFLITFPRMVHAELMTHRVFSRNAASSRAIPVKKMIEAVRRTPAMPVRWGANQKGMQASKDLTGWRLWACRWLWLRGRDLAVLVVRGMLFCRLHKQLANRLLEPWSHITVLLTGTEFQNFFCLRAQKDAQPEFQVLAFSMLGDYLASTPQSLHWGQWHSPFSDSGDEGNSSIEELLKVATARAARTSYTVVGDDTKTPSLSSDVDLHDNLTAAGHWSPAEHSAKAEKDSTLGGNFGPHWTQYRKTFPFENRKGDLSAIYGAMPDWVHDALEAHRG